MHIFKVILIILWQHLQVSVKVGSLANEDVVSLFPGTIPQGASIMPILALTKAKLYITEILAI